MEVTRDITRRLTTMFSNQNCVGAAMTGTFDPRFIELIASLVRETRVIVKP
jgi:hypothetical protein